jgi:hypothetical protein
VDVSRTALVAVFRTVTLTSRTSAALGSVTVPVIVPVFNWANAAVAHKSGKTGRQKRDVMYLNLSAEFRDAHGDKRKRRDHQVLLWLYRIA